MIKQQLVFALRRFSRHKLTTTINVLGLTLGVLSCLVIYLFVKFEFSYDTFHADRDRIYSVVVWTTNSDGTSQWWNRRLWGFYPGQSGEKLRCRHPV